MTRIIKIERNGSQTSINEHFVNKENDVKIYPNPAKSIVNLKSNHDIKSVELSDLSGKLIMKTLVPKNSLDISQVHKGMYFLRISTDKGIFVNKIIKE